LVGIPTSIQHANGMSRTLERRPRRRRAIDLVGSSGGHPIRRRPNDGAPQTATGPETSFRYNARPAGLTCDAKDLSRRPAPRTRSRGTPGTRQVRSCGCYPGTGLSVCRSAASAWRFGRNSAGAAFTLPGKTITPARRADEQLKEPRCGHEP
jgi:hypothetical protein